MLANALPRQILHLELMGCLSLIISVLLAWFGLECTFGHLGCSSSQSHLISLVRACCVLILTLRGMAQAAVVLFFRLQRMWMRMARSTSSQLSAPTWAAWCSGILLIRLSTAPAMEPVGQSTGSLYRALPNLIWLNSEAEGLSHCSPAVCVETLLHTKLSEY